MLECTKCVMCNFNSIHIYPNPSAGTPVPGSLVSPPSFPLISPLPPPALILPCRTIDSSLSCTCIQVLCALDNDLIIRSISSFISLFVFVNNHL